MINNLENTAKANVNDERESSFYDTWRMTCNQYNYEFTRLIKGELQPDGFLLADEYLVTPDSQLDSMIKSSDLVIYEEINDDFIKESIIIRNKFEKLNNY